MISYIVAFVCLALSFYFSKEKSVKALKIARNKFLKVLPAFLLMLIFVSLAIGLLPEEVYSKYLSKENGWTSFLSGLGLGSITMMPGFIAFPLSGILLSKGVSYTTLSVFTSSLMMVGVLTFPVEKKYLGFKVAFVRNLINVFVAIIIALITGFFYGEFL